MTNLIGVICAALLGAAFLLLLEAISNPPGERMAPMREVIGFGAAAGVGGYLLYMSLP